MTAVLLPEQNRDTKRDDKPACVSLTVNNWGSNYDDPLLEWQTRDYQKGNVGTPRYRLGLPVCQNAVIFMLVRTLGHSMKSRTFHNNISNG